MPFFYQILIHLFNISVHIASLFNSKAKKFVKGRKNIFGRLTSLFPSPHGNGITRHSPRVDEMRIWLHCSSLGEFEQVRPLIEQLSMKNEKIKILITFFSPSGYEIRKNYDKAALVCYLPIDTKKNAKRFIEIIRPSLVFFVKYDFWYNYLSGLHKRKIPSYLVSANFRDEQFNKFYGRYLRKVLSFFTHIFVQNEKSRHLLHKQKIQNVTVSGDLRYDNVSQTVSSPKQIPIVEYFSRRDGDKKEKSKIIIAGSTWEKDEEIIGNWSKGLSVRRMTDSAPLFGGKSNSTPSEKLEIGNWKLIIAPHEINENHIKSTIQQLSHSAILRYSEISCECIPAGKEPVSTAMEKLQKAKILVIDNIGILSHLYQYADIAYTGGGFGNGIHNILEAVAFGVPVIFGPNHKKFPEAQELIDCGGGFCISGENDFQNVMHLLLSDKKILLMASMMCKNFVQSRRGATGRIIEACIPKEIRNPNI